MGAGREEGKMEKGRKERRKKRRGGGRGGRRKRRGRRRKVKWEGCVLLSKWDPVSGSPVAMGKLLITPALYLHPTLSSDCRVDPP